MSDDGAWNWYRVRAGFRRGYLAGFLTCGSIAWVCYMLGLSMPVTMVALSGAALIAFGVERVASRVAAKDYLKSSQ